MKTISFYLFLICLSWSLVSCSQLNVNNFARSSKSIMQLTGSNTTLGKLSEVAPPQVIRELSKSLQRSPQVTIISPKADETFNSTSVSVKLEVKDLSVFKDDKLGLGPHLHLILDNEPYQAVYNTEEPVILTNLAPGTHTLRVFASRPWHESFKNDGAYAQTSFNILTKTNNNNPDSNLPLLTYSRPTGTYSAEPIMLDFYLTNAPLHSVARKNPDDDIKDWRIRVTINGESFILDEWQPVYLSGFVKGNNWVQLELLDEAGDNIENAFNNIVRLVNYQPETKDTLAKLVTGEISAAEARPIIEQNYYVKPVKEPEIKEPEVDVSKQITESEVTKTLEIKTIPGELEKPELEPANKAEKQEVTAEQADTNLSNSTLENTTPEEVIILQAETTETVEQPIEQSTTILEQTTISIDEPEEETSQSYGLATQSTNDSSAIESAKTESEKPGVAAIETTLLESEKIVEEENKVSEAVPEESAIATTPEVETIEIPQSEKPANTPPQPSKSKAPDGTKNIGTTLQQIIQDVGRISSGLIDSLRIKTVELLTKIIEAIDK